MSTCSVRALVGWMLGAAVLGGLLCAGVFKLIALDEFRISLDEWKFIPVWSRTTIALTLPTIEAMIGGCWVLGMWRRACLIAAIALLSLFLGVSGYHLLWDQKPNCNCFGVLEAYFNQHHSLQVSMWRGAGLLIAGSVSLLLGRANTFTASSSRNDAKCRRSSDRAVGGYSLIELICVIAVVVVLFSIVVPSLRFGRRAGMGTVTLSRLRTHAAMLAMYAADWKDSVVCWGDPADAKLLLNVDGSEYTTQSFFSISIVWPDAVASVYYQTKRSDPVFFPQEQVAIRGPGGTPIAMSCSLLADSEFWFMPTRAGVSQVKGQRLSSVAFPSSKSAFISAWSFFNERVDATRDEWRMSDPAYENMPEAVRPVPIGFVDGSARVYQRQDTNPGIFMGEVGGGNALFHGFDVWAGLHTVDGVRGVDVKR